jgi:hypothetical protein
MKTISKKKLNKAARLTPEQARIVTSFESARRKLDADASGQTKMLKAVSAAGDECNKLDEAIFGAFKILGPTFLDKDDWLRKTLMQRTAKAIADKDGNFLIRLGRAMQSEPNKRSFDKLDLWLVGAWLPQKKGMFGLCDCTDEVLTEYLKRATGREKLDAKSKEQLTLEAVVKRRQRLGLVKSHKPAVIRVRIINGKADYSLRSNPVFAFS